MTRHTQSDVMPREIRDIEGIAFGIHQDDAEADDEGRIV